MKKEGYCKKHDVRWTPAKLGCPACQDLETGRIEMLKFSCGIGCKAGFKNEMLLCGLKKGHRGEHAWASLPSSPSAPMGVSQWREYGKKHGYWDYFKELSGKEK